MDHLLSMEKEKNTKEINWYDEVRVKLLLSFERSGD